MNKVESDKEPLEIIKALWQGHLDTPFPARLRGKDVNGIDFVLLDADIAGCVQTFLQQGSLNVFSTATLGLCYHHVTIVLPILYDEGMEYFWRLERLSELVLRALIKQTHTE